MEDDPADGMRGEVAGEDDEPTVVSHKADEPGVNSAVGDDSEAGEVEDDPADDSSSNSNCVTEDEPDSSTYEQLMEGMFRELLGDRQTTGGDDDGRGRQGRLQRDGTTQHLNSPHGGPLDYRMGASGHGESSKSDDECGGILTTGSESEAEEEYEGGGGVLILSDGTDAATPPVPKFIYTTSLDDRLDTGGVQPPADEMNDSRRGLGADEPVRPEGAASCDPSSNADDAADIERSFEMVEHVLDRRLHELNSESQVLDDRVRAVETRHVEAPLDR